MGNACLRTAAEGSAACGAALTEYAVKEERRSHMKQPKVSVIIPVYNTEAYLRECLDSVVNQTLEDIEIFCVDDGSTDASAELLRACQNTDRRIRVLLREHSGAGPARNAGIEAAEGKYITFLVLHVTLVCESLTDGMERKRIKVKK